MKPKSTLRSFLVLAGSTLLAVSSTRAATLYWDGGTINIVTTGNGVSGGTAGDWDSTDGENTTNWDQGAGLAHVAWDNTDTIPNPLDTAFFGGTADTVTLTDPITVGGLGFFSNSGYTITAGTEELTFGATTNHVRMLNVTGTTSTATISGKVTGSGNLVFTSVAPDVFSTLTLSGTSTGGWSGTTTINAGFTLALSGLNQGLNSTTGGITLNGGNITLTNTAGTAVDNNRISSAAITANGGTLALANTSGANVYAETIGSVALTTGQTNLVFSTNAAGAGSQTLTLGGLTRTGASNTSAVTLSSASFLNTTKNMMVVTGAAAPAPGQITGSWATTGNTASQTDYAVYNGSAQVVPAGINASAQTGWTTAANAYTADATAGTGLAESFTLAGGTKNITALKWSSTSTAATADFASDVITQASHVFVDGDAVVFNNGTLPTGLALNTPYFVRDAGAGTYKLAATSGGAAIDFTLSNGTGITAVGAIQVTNGNNLGTTGILNASGNTMYVVASGNGVLTLPSASSGQLHVNAGNGPIVISAPITNNASAPGVLTLVKNGGNTLTLTGTNLHTGGTAINAGSLAIGNVNNIGGASANLTFGGTATFAPSAALNFSGGTLTVNTGGYGTITGNGATAFATTTGAGTLRYTSDANTKSLNLGNASGFTGNLEYRLNGNANYSASSATVQFSSLGDGVGSVLQVGGGQSDSTTPGQRANIVLNGAAALVFDNRVIELLPRINSNHTVQTTQLRNDSGNAAHTWTINTDLSYQVDQSRSLELNGTNTGNNAFNGVISDGNLGGTISFRKDGGGRWILGGNNTYTGSTSVVAGILNIQHANALGATSGTTTVDSGATLQLQGGVSYAAEPLSMAATSTTTVRLQSLSGNNTWNGGIVVTGSSNFVRISSDADRLTLAGTNTTGSAGAGFVLQGASAITVSGQITGAGNVISGSTGAGAGSIRTLSNATNNYTGSTSITGGTLVGIGANAFGDTTGISMGATAGATLSLRGDTSTNFVKSSDDATLYSVTTTTASGVTIDVDRATVAGTSAKTMSIGTLGLNAAVTNGTTFTGANNTSLSIGAVTTGNSASGTETLTNNISVGGALTLASVAVARTGTPTLAFAGKGNTTVTGAISQVANTALTKSGAGTLLLNGTNTYTGLTNVNAGTLGGTGTIDGDVTVAAAGSLAPGASAGTLIIDGGLDVSDQVDGGTGKLKFELGADTGTSDQLDVNGTLTTGGELGFSDFEFTYLSGGPQNGTYVLITTGAAPTGALDGSNLGGTIGGGGTGTLGISGNNIVLNVSGLGGGNPFLTWSGAADFNVDTNQDGLDNGLAWLLGASDKNVSAVGLLPELDDSDSTCFIFTYRRADSANGDPNTTITAQYGTTLASWATAVDNDDIDIIVTDNHYAASPGVDRVQVKLKRSTLAPGGKLFARLKVVQP